MSNQIAVLDNAPNPIVSNPLPDNEALNDLHRS